MYSIAICESFLRRINVLTKYLTIRKLIEITIYSNTIQNTLSFKIVQESSFLGIRRVLELKNLEQIKFE